ncbi:MAG: putative quinol monooxygenase [Cryomorphaceae bacterium]
MIIRIVELQFTTGSAEKAETLVKNIAPKVRKSEGCHYLDILIDIHRKGHISTFSKWESEAHLNAYRDSDLFRNFWGSVKPLFEVPAKAWSSFDAVHLP